MFPLRLHSQLEKKITFQMNYQIATWESHQRDFLFMSKRKDCQINSCLTPSLHPCCPYMGALHESCMNIKGKMAHVIGAGARSACHNTAHFSILHVELILFPTVRTCQHGLGNWCTVFSLVNWILKEPLFTQETIMNSLPLWLKSNHNIQPCLKMTSKRR